MYLFLNYFLIGFFIFFIIVIKKTNYPEIFNISRNGFWLNPIITVYFFLLFCFFLVPSVQYYTESFRLGTYKVESLMLGQTYLLIFFISMLLIFSLINKLVPMKSEMDDIEKDIQPQKIKRIFIFMIPGLLLAVLKLQTISILSYSEYLTNRISLLAGDGYSILMITSLIPLSVLSILIVLNSNRKIYSKIILVSIFLMISFTPGLITGSRTNLLLPLILIIVSHLHYKYIKNNYAVNKVKIMIFSGCILAVIFSGLLLEDSRQKIMSGAYYVKSDKNEIEKLAGGFGTSENIFWAVENYRGSYYYGETLLAVLASPIPRDIWENKPLGGGPTWTNIIFPGSYTLGYKNITSYTTGFPFEMYLNFGWFGSFLGAIPITLMIVYIQRKYLSRKNIYSSLIYAVGLFVILSLFNGEIFGTLTKGVFLITPLLILELIDKKRLEKL